MTGTITEPPLRHTSPLSGGEVAAERDGCAVGVPLPGSQCGARQWPDDHLDRPRRWVFVSRSVTSPWQSRPEERRPSQSRRRPAEFPPTGKQNSARSWSELRLLVLFRERNTPRGGACFVAEGVAPQVAVSLIAWRRVHSRPVPPSGDSFRAVVATRAAGRTLADRPERAPQRGDPDTSCSCGAGAGTVAMRSSAAVANTPSGH